MLWFLALPLRGLLWLWGWIPWLMGWDLAYVDAVGPVAAKSMYGEVVGLLGLIVTNAIALTLAVRQTYAGPSCWLWLAYAIITTSALAGMVCILRAEATAVRFRDNYWAEPSIGSEPRTHAFERGSIMFTRFAVWGGAALASTFALMIGLGEGPSQGVTEKVDVKLEKPAKHKFTQTGKEGVRVSFVLGKELFPKGVPPQLEGEVILHGRTASDWDVRNMTIAYTVDAKDPPAFQPFLERADPKKTPKSAPFSLESLEKKEYRVSIYLHPTHPKALVDVAITEIENNDAVKVILYWKKLK